MAVHDELRPDSEQLPYLMASDAMRMARGLESRSLGYLGIPDTDGSETIIGPEQNGTTVVPWVGDTTAPGRPVGVTATSDMQCAIVRWDGELEGGIPSDFRCVTVYAMRLESEIDYDSEPDDSTSTAAVVDTITLGDLTAAGEVASGILEVGDTYDIWAVAYDDAHDRYGNPAYNASAESEHVQVTIVPLVTREQMEQTAQEILDGAKASADAQIKQVEATMGEISDAVASNTDAIVLEQTLREEGDKAAQATANAVKAETDKIKGDYAGMATDVANAQADIVKLATQTGNLAETTIVRSVVEYAVGTGTTAPTSGWNTATPTVSGSQRAWMRTTVTYGDGRSETTNPVVVTGATGPQGATGAQGVSVTAITPFYCIASSKPAQPTNKAPGGAWTTTEPAYVKDKSLYTCQRVDYSNRQWSWTSVQLSSSYGLASVALMTANGKNKRWVQRDAPSSADLQQSDEWWQTSSKPLETYWTGEPNNSPSVLVDHSDEVEHIYVWNGSRWNEQLLSAQYLIVPGTIDAGLVTARFFDGAVVKGGAFLTSNERIKLTNAGFVMVDASGHPLVTLDAIGGTATFQDVHIIDGALSAPTVSGGTFNGGEYNILDSSGKLIASINPSGVTFGDSLAYGYDSKLKRWTLTLDGALMSKGELSGVTVIGSTIATNREDKTGIKMTDAGLVAYKDKTPTFEITADGTILMDGGLTSNLTIKAPSVEGGVFTGGTFQTRASNAYCIRLTGGKLDAYNESGGKIVEIDTSGAGKAKFIGSFRTGSGDSYITMESQSGLYSGSGYIRGVIKNSDVWTIHADYSKTGNGTMITSSWGLNLLGDEFLLAVRTSGFKALNITADTMSISGNALYVNGQNLVPDEYTSAAFLSYSTGFQDYMGWQNNTSRCYAIKTGFMIVLQIEVSGKIPSSAKYTKVATLRPNWIPRRSINVPAAFNNGVQGTAFIIGEKADGTYTPGGVYFAQKSGSAANWCSATFVMFQYDLTAAADTAVAGSSVEAAQKLVTQGMSATAAANLMNVPTASVTQ